MNFEKNLLDLPKLVKSRKNANGVKKTKMFYIIKISVATNSSHILFWFEIIFFAHSSIYFLVLGHLVDFGFRGKKKLCNFMSFSSSYNLLHEYLNRHIYLISCILTPF